MNKLSTFFKVTLAVIRGLVMFLFVVLPGVAAFFYWFVFQDVNLELAIAGGLGVEFVWCILFTIGALIREAWQERKRRGLDDLEL